MSVNNFEPNDKYIIVEKIQYQIQNLAIIEEPFQFNLDERLVAVAKYGGPIAIYKNPQRTDLFRQNDFTKDNICFYSNNYVLINKCEFNCEQMKFIVGFDFTDDEFLIVLMNNGIYYLVDPYKNARTKQKQFSLSSIFINDEIQNAKIQDNNIIFITKSNTFYVISNPKNPQTQKIIQMNEYIQPQKWFFSKQELYLITQNTIVNYKGNQDPRILVKALNIYAIKQSFQSKNFAFLTLNEREQFWNINIYSNENQQIQIKVEDLYSQYKKQQNNEHTSQQQQLQIYWSGDHTIVIYLLKSGVFIIPLNSKKQLYLQSKDYYFFQQEVDGLKSISTNKNILIRRVPKSHVNIFEDFSVEPASLLFEAYQSLQNKDPLNDEDIRNDTQKLQIAVLDCIEAAKYEICVQVQVLLLKSASYGKMFIQCGKDNKQENIQIGEICKILRIINHLRNSYLCRTLTYNQFKEMSQEQLIKILLRYNMHYLADEVVNQLRFQDRFQSSIYLHWASEKVCANNEKISENTLCKKIWDKTKRIKGICYSDIAQKALEVGKVELAGKLLEYEDNWEKRIGVLLWIFENNASQTNFLEKAIEESIKSQNSEVIFQLINFLWNFQGFSIDIKWGYFKSNIILEKHLVLFLFAQSNFLQAINFFRVQGDFLKAGIFHIQKCIQDNASGIYKANILEFLQETMTVFIQDNSANNDKFYQNFVKELFQGISSINEEDKKAFQQLKLGEFSLNENYFKKKMINNEKGSDKEIQKLTKQMQINERRVALVKIRVLIEKENFDEIENILDNINKKKIVVPYELVANLLIKKGFQKQGISILLKMQEFDEMNQILFRIGQTKQAVLNAIQKKNVKLLLQFKTQINNDKELVDLIEQQLNLIKK